MSINRIVLLGRLTRDPELRTTATGKSVTNFSIAVDKRVKPKDDGEPHADFFNCLAWEKTADFVTNYTHKGDLICVDGYVQQRKYTTKEGVQKDVFEIVAERVHSLAPKREGSPAPTQANVHPEEYDPFADE